MVHHISSHKEAHSSASPTATHGHLIHWATRYDWMVLGMTLGRARQLRKRMADLVPLRAGDIVLDIGCGTGDLAFQLARRVGPSGKVIGIDPSVEMIERARRKAKNRHLAIDFKAEPVEALSLPDRSLDYAVSTLVFHHLPGELRKQALISVARALKEGGELIIVDFVATSGHTLTHAAQQGERVDMHALLQEAGFETLRSGRIPFKMIGAPQLGFVSARLTSHPSA